MSCFWACILGILVAFSFATPARACLQPFIGQICIFAFDYCPKGFYPANGQSLSQTTEAVLYAVIGTKFGSSAAGQFSLPNLNGRAPVGSGDQITLGQTLGQSEVTLHSSQVPLPPHTHTNTLIIENLNQIPTSAQASLPVSGTIAALTVTGQANLAVSGSAFVATSNPAGPTTNIVSPNATLTSAAYETASLYVPADMAGELIPVGPAGRSVRGAATGSITAAANDVPVAGKAAGVVTGHLAAGPGTSSPIQIGTSAPAAAANSVPTQSPSLALTFCIAATGTYASQN